MNSAKEQKERNYAILAKRIKTMSSQLSQTEALFDNLQGDLESMKVLAALHASQFMAVSRLLDSEELQNPKSPRDSQG